MLTFIQKIINFSNHHKNEYGLYFRKIDIILWLEKNNIKDYKLLADDKYGYVVNTIHEVDLSEKKLKTIDVKFNVINGWFSCAFNELSSLQGCPEEVMGGFNCSYNNLLSLEHSPKMVEGDFNCTDNQLQSLLWCPKEIGKSLIAQNNNITNLIYFPEKIGRFIFMDGNEALNNLQIESDFDKFFGEHKKQCTQYYKEDLETKINHIKNVETPRKKNKI